MCSHKKSQNDARVRWTSEFQPKMFAAAPSADYCLDIKPFRDRCFSVEHKWWNATSHHIASSILTPTHSWHQLGCLPQTRPQWQGKRLHLPCLGRIASWMHPGWPWMGWLQAATAVSYSCNNNNLQAFQLIVDQVLTRCAWVLVSSANTTSRHYIAAVATVYIDCGLTDCLVGKISCTLLALKHCGADGMCCQSSGRCYIWHYKSYVQWSAREDVSSHVDK